jgi:hypothetical protein
MEEDELLPGRALAGTSTGQTPRAPVKPMRWIGFFMFIGGLVLGYLAVILPLLAASRHEEDVSISLKGVVLVPGLIVIGLILFFMGNERAGQLMGSKEKHTLLGWVICIVTAGVGILLYEWLRSRLRAYGYNI